MSIELTDASTIKLRPCRFVKETADRFGIIRRAGTRRVVVRSGGLEACRRFRDGCAIREAKLHLAAHYKISEDAVDLRPLLRSLQNADLIAYVDGKHVREAGPPSIYSAYRYYLRFHLKHKLLRLAYKKLPLLIGKKLAHWTHRLDLSAILWPKALCAAQHASASPATALSVSVRRRFARRYFRNLIQNIVDFESVEAMSPLEEEEWFDKHLEYDGLEHLARLKREGVPVIVAGFHFSTTKLLALLLMRRGYDATQLWVPDGSVDMASITTRLAELKKVKPEYGKLDIIPDFSLPSYRRLLKSLRNGELLVWFADMFGNKEQVAPDPGKQDWREAAARVFDFSQIRTELPKAKLDVMLCGQRVYLNPWIGGFARTAGAAVVPAAVVREGSRLRMMLMPALRLPPQATAKHVDDLNRELFGHLDLLLRRYPDQWFGWHSLCPVPQTGLSSHADERHTARFLHQQFQSERR